jgi:hypothetical protein
MQHKLKVVNTVKITTLVKEDMGKPCRWSSLGQATDVGNSDGDQMKYAHASFPQH